MHTDTSTPLERPDRPRYRGNNVDEEPRRIEQPVRTSRASEPEPFTIRNDTDGLIAARALVGRPVVEIEEIQDLRKFTGVPIDEIAEKHDVTLMGGNQGGRYPQDPNQTRNLPPSADYTERRPEQILSHFSKLSYHALEQDQVVPVEVQFGYGVRADGSVRLFASTNNAASQDALARKLRDTGTLIKSSAGSDDQTIAEIGQKQLFFPEQQQQRRAALGDAPDTEQLRGELALTDRLREAFLNGPITVVKNKFDRHAEQNVGDAIHADQSLIVGEVAGTMIRCEGCSAEIGSNLRAENGRMLIGRIYASQASEQRHDHVFNEVESGRTQVVTNRSERSHSVSPPRALAADAAARDVDMGPRQDGPLHVSREGRFHEYQHGYQQPGSIIAVNGDSIVQKIPQGTATYSREELLSRSNPVDRPVFDAALRPGNYVEIRLGQHGLNMQQRLPDQSWQRLGGEPQPSQSLAHGGR